MVPKVLRIATSANQPPNSKSLPVHSIDSEKI